MNDDEQIQEVDSLIDRILNSDSFDRGRLFSDQDIKLIINTLEYYKEDKGWIN